MCANVCLFLCVVQVDLARVCLRVYLAVCLMYDIGMMILTDDSYFHILMRLHLSCSENL